MYVDTSFILIVDEIMIIDFISTFLMPGPIGLQLGPMECV
jgi:hypothetical protein